jgi:hypothetical protein
MFLGRIMGFNANIVDVDDLGIYAVGSYQRGRSQVRRIPKDAATEPRLQDEPANEILASGYDDHLLTPEGLYTLEARRAPLNNGRLVYLSRRAEPGTAPTVVIPEANKILGEWDGWLYALRSRGLIDTAGLGREQAAALRADPDNARRWDVGCACGFWWRFGYELVRAQLGGKAAEPATIAEVPATVDAVFDGQVYGREYDPGTRELRIFRLPVPGGAREVLYRRVSAGWGRGGVRDHIGKVAVDGDGVFFYDAPEGVVRRMAHAGGETRVVVSGLAFSPGVELRGEILSVWGDEYLKSGRRLRPTTRIEPDTMFGSGRWESEGWSAGRKGDTLIVLGQERGPGLWGEPRGFIYRYMPGGIIEARRFPYRPGFLPAGPLGFDDECIYYTARDWTNTWFYALPRPASATK